MALQSHLNEQDNVIEGLRQQMTQMSVDMAEMKELLAQVLDKAADETDEAREKMRQEEQNVREVTLGMPWAFDYERIKEVSI